MIAAGYPLRTHRLLSHRNYFILLLGFLLLSLQACHVGRYFMWNLADINDYKRFPSITIQASSDILPLTESKSFVPAGIVSLYDGRYKDFETLFKKTSTLAFIILKHDQIVYEEYGNGFDSSSIIPSFSVAKAFISALAGIAVYEGYFQDVHDPVTKYLPAGFHPTLSQVKLIDLLNMQAGLNFREAYATPFSKMAKYYYGRQLDSYVRKLQPVVTPGTEYDYQSAATQLLGMAIEHATGRNLMAYLEEKIWQPAGMVQDASWSLDKTGGIGKFFCCLNAKPRDFARFGLLYINEGRREDTQVIPREWVRESRRGSEKFTDSQGYPYVYQWRVTPEGGMFAKGVLGQYIYVHPEKEMVIVRLGKKSAGLDWGILFAHLVSSLDK